MNHELREASRDKRQANYIKRELKPKTGPSPITSKYARSVLRHKELKLKLDRNHELREASRDKRQANNLHRQLKPKHPVTPVKGVNKKK